MFTWSCTHGTQRALPRQLRGSALASVGEPCESGPSIGGDLRPLLAAGCPPSLFREGPVHSGSRTFVETHPTFPSWPGPENQHSVCGTFSPPPSTGDSIRISKRCTGLPHEHRTGRRRGLDGTLQVHATDVAADGTRRRDAVNRLLAFASRPVADTRYRAERTLASKGSTRHEGEKPGNVRARLWC